MPSLSPHFPHIPRRAHTPCAGNWPGRRTSARGAQGPVAPNGLRNGLPTYLPTVDSSPTFPNIYPHFHTYPPLCRDLFCPNQAGLRKRWAPMHGATPVITSTPHFLHIFPSFRTYPPCAGTWTATGRQGSASLSDGRLSMALPPVITAPTISHTLTPTFLCRYLDCHWQAGQRKLERWAPVHGAQAV